MDIGKMHGVVGLAACEHEAGGFAMATDRILRIELPERFKPEDIQRIQKDFEILAEVTREYPQEVASLLKASMENNLHDAAQLAEKIGLREEDVRTRGGGIIWGLVAVIVVADVLFDMRRFGLRM